MAMYQTTMATIDELGKVRNNIQDSLDDINLDIDRKGKDIEKNRKDIENINKDIVETKRTIIDNSIFCQAKLDLVKNKQKYLKDKITKYLKIILGLEIADFIVDFIEYFM